MYCIDCGTELVNGICPKCQENEKSNTRQNPTVIYISEKPKKEPTSAKIFSIICILTGALGLFGYGYPYLSIAAIVLAIMYKSKMKEHCLMTKAGNIMGIVGLSVQTVVLALSAVFSAIAAIVSTLVSLIFLVFRYMGVFEQIYNFFMTYISNYISYFI